MKQYENNQELKNLKMKYVKVLKNNEKRDSLLILMIISAIIAIILLVVSSIIFEHKNIFMAYGLCFAISVEVFCAIYSSFLGEKNSGLVDGLRLGFLILRHKYDFSDLDKRAVEGEVLFKDIQNFLNLS